MTKGVVAVITRETKALCEVFELRAYILDRHGGFPRAEAELEAGQITAAYARDCGYRWESLRLALADYPALLSQLPGTVGPVDTLPLGLAKPAALPKPRAGAMEFVARLFAEDLAAVAAQEAEELREAFEKRAGILEFDAGLPKDEAELEAARITATYARNKAYLWTSLRSALADYPQFLAQLPDKAGQVDALPLGVAKVAVLPGRRVVKQGTHTV